MLDLENKMLETYTNETAKDYIRIARSHANFKKTEGYKEDDYTFYEIINLNASIEICHRGPADYYYENAYLILCNDLGSNHKETKMLAKEITGYHLDIVKRMMFERFFIDVIFTIPLCFLLIRELYGTWQKILAFVVCYAFLSLYWYFVTLILCFMEKRNCQALFANIQKEQSN